MIGVDVLEELSDAVVRAGIDPLLWPAVLELVVARLPGVSASLMGTDSAATRHLGVYSAGLEQPFVDAYIRRYGALNPWNRFWAEAPVMKAFTADAVMPASTFASTEFFADWLAPTRRLHGSGIKILQSPEAHAVMTVNYESDLAQHLNLALPGLLNALRGSMRGAMELNRHLTGPTLPDGSPQQLIIEASPLPCIVTDSTGRIIATNARAAEHFRQKSVPFERAGYLSVDGGGPADEALMRALADATLGAGPADPRFPVMEGGRIACIATILPFGRATDDQLAWLLGRRRQALVVLRGVQPPLEDARRNLIALFDLTRQEAEIALRLTSGLSIAEVSAVLGISVQTGRKHLTNIFHKMKIRRQAELVSAVRMLT